MPPARDTRSATPGPASAGTVYTDGTIEVDLKNHRLAALLAWLIPGAGHLYQGRTGKGVLFMLCILGTFFYGLYLGGGRVVYAATANVVSSEFLGRWQYVCQLGVGVAAMPAYVQAMRADAGKAPLISDGFMRPPQAQPPEGGEFATRDRWDNRVVQPDELGMWHYKLGDNFDLGTVFTVIAGLLNVLAIYDAHSGPLILPPPDDKRKKDPDDEDKKLAGDTRYRSRANDASTPPAN